MLIKCSTVPVYSKMSLTLKIYEVSSEKMFASRQCQCQCHHVTDLFTAIYAHVVTMAIVKTIQQSAAVILNKT
jgi:hypothetical protein